MEVKIIGRDAKCDIIINDPHVSREHLQIMKDKNGNYSLFDLESTTGTYVNGKKIKGEVKLQNHDVVKIGNTLLKWKMFFNENITIEKEEKEEDKITEDVIKTHKNESFEAKKKNIINNSFEIANFWERLAAIFIDGIILFIISFLINYTLMYYVTYNFSFDDTMIFHYIITFIIYLLYFTLSESSNKQATFGKQLFKIKVSKNDGFSKISFINATGRYLAKYISTLALLIGWLMPFWTDKKQTLHDIMANTLIVRTATL